MPSQPPVQWYRVFPGVKEAGAWCWPPIKSSAEVANGMELCLSLLSVPLVACYGVTFVFTVSLIWELSEILRLLRQCVFTCGSSQLCCTQRDRQTDRQTVCTASGGVLFYNLLLKIIKEDTIKRSCDCLYCSVYQEYLLDWWLMLFENSISTV